VRLIVIFIFSVIHPSAETLPSSDKALHPVVASTVVSSTPMIVVGFVGGFVRRDDLRHSEVQLAQKLRAAHPDHVRIATFENWHRKAAHRAILRWLDTDEDGELSVAEKRDARIVLFGHSWGGAAVISLARELQRESIPVLLTVQVDSIAKPGQDDRVVPANVVRAINFYQTRGFLHGRSRITAADPAHTEILGDFSFDYKQPPAECSQYPWLTRHLFPGHTAIECDPQVWSQIESLIDKYSFVGQAASVAGLR
jgi:pimeloyl-ACP methyl ester carboxylesterase